MAKHNTCWLALSIYTARTLVARVGLTVGVRISTVACSARADLGMKRQYILITFAFLYLLCKSTWIKFFSICVKNSNLQHVTLCFEFLNKIACDVIFRRPFGVTYGSVAPDTAVSVGSARAGLARIGDGLHRWLASQSDVVRSQTIWNGDRSGKFVLFFVLRYLEVKLEHCFWH